MFDDKYKYTVTDRFLRYVTFDTQSDENSVSFPSTDKQLVLLQELVKELEEVGMQKVNLDEYGYLTATLPSNVGVEVPTVGFFAHVDTSSAVSGQNVKPMFHRNYEGQEIRLPGDRSQVISLQTNPELAQMFGQDLITTDGTTLLGGDDKCGVAEIVDAMNYLITHPEIKHGPIKVCFNPDEEIGLGMKYFDVVKFGADFGYTLDSNGVGNVEVENFNAAEVVVDFFGKNTHPGYAKSKMINAVKLANWFLNRLPAEQSPEAVEGRQGYIHPMQVFGNEEQATIKLILRDFEMKGLKEKKELLESLMLRVVNIFSKSRVELKYKEQYYNMKTILDKHPEVVSKAMQAYRNLGLKPEIKYIRGGTDGVLLAQKGLPCPNLSSGQHNLHSKTEFTSRQEMELAVRSIVEIARLWAE